jgi:TPR repeat protein
VAPAAPANPPAVPQKTAAAPASVEKIPTKPATLTISPLEEAERLKRGQAALANDDIPAARLIFEYLANRGSAAGAYQLALTYDPQIQTRDPFGTSVRPDRTLAEQWYRKAAELGHPKAREALAAGQ